MQVQSKKVEIFQVGKIYIKNHKMIDNWSNAKLYCPIIFMHRGLMASSSNSAVSLTNGRVSE